MVRRREIACLDSYGGMAMQDPTVPWEAKHLMRSTVVLKPDYPVLYNHVWGQNCPKKVPT
jgi:hypothetical protein